MKLSIRNEAAQTGCHTDADEELTDKQAGALRGVAADAVSVPPQSAWTAASQVPGLGTKGARRGPSYVNLELLRGSDGTAARECLGKACGGPGTQGEGAGELFWW